ncbi:hypothetical protein [Streptomyces corynorhini]|uniref:Uncharacterized protein n=1 Tax=Streptomyces corynorhini TaxID=2282652 RepID=A0A370B160_9ACTN|nr:hypothetical protein [Streptomyces corynorhini]RDG35560.1 hypothetical protein DVH02_24735 [Streptomyces corynorhini]
MADWVRLTAGLVVGGGALVIAFDVRHLGLRFYDLLAEWSPGGGLDPRFSPDVLRGIAGVLGVVGLAVTGVRVFGML